MFYDRKIKYFDYKQNGERICGGGFVKIEVRNGICSFDFRISGLHVKDTFTKQIYLVAWDKEEVLCDIHIKEGRGEKQISVSEKNMQGNMDYTQLRAIRIPIALGCELYCEVSGEKKQEVVEKVIASEKAESGEKVIAAEKAEPGEKIIASEKAESDKKVIASEKVNAEERDKVAGKAGTDNKAAPLEKAEADIKVDMDEKEETDKTVKAYEKKEADETVKVEPDVPIMLEQEERKMQEDKWKQLKSIYPHIRPFDDEREYLKLGPEDFVIFNSRFYKLVHNSFLLHGYYNYQHLILACMERRGIPYYYIGVPGNYYAREKQVALLFGFESFECKAEPADTGDFGYYMIKVEI